MKRGRFQHHVDLAQDSAGAGVAGPDTAASAGMSVSGSRGSKAESTQRLQIGLFGLGSMVLLIGLATIIGNQADLTEEDSVPEAAPTTEPTEVATQSDPLADAGIVPDIPVEAPEEEVEAIVEDLPESAAEEAEASEASGEQQ